MRASKRFHYVIVASHDEGGESVAAGATGPDSIQTLIDEFRAMGLTRIQVIETAMPASPGATQLLHALAAE